MFNVWLGKDKNYDLELEQDISLRLTPIMEVNITNCADQVGIKAQKTLIWTDVADVVRIRTYLL